MREADDSEKGLKRTLTASNLVALGIGAIIGAGLFVRTLVNLQQVELGFKHVESAPLVRSSYHARDQVPGAELRRLRREATIDAEGRIVPLAG